MEVFDYWLNRVNDFLSHPDDSTRDICPHCQKKISGYPLSPPVSIVFPFLDSVKDSVRREES